MSASAPRHHSEERGFGRRLLAETLGPEFATVGGLSAGVAALPSRIQVQTIALLLMPVVAAVLSPTPRSVGVPEAIYGLLFVTAVATWATRRIRDRSLTATAPELAMLAVVTVFSLTVLWAIPSGTPLSAWARGMVPLLNALLVFPATEVAQRRLGRVGLISGLCIGALLVAAQIYAATLQHLPDLIRAGSLVRLQPLLPAQGFSPLLVAGTAYSLGGLLLEPAGRRRNGILLAIFLPAVLLTLLKSLLLIFAVLGAALAVVAVRRARRGAWGAIRGWALRSRVRIGLSVAVVAVAGGFMVLIALAYTRKFAELLAAGIAGNTRVAEYTAVVQQWSTSPLFGKGLGFEYSYLRPETGVTWLGTYTHNLLSFAALDAGAFGVVVVGAALVVWTTTALSVLKNGTRGAAGPAAAILALLCYAMVEATFRTLSFWAVLAILVGMLAFQLPEALRLRMPTGD
jgi:hypothetical protein